MKFFKSLHKITYKYCTLCLEAFIFIIASILNYQILAIEILFLVMRFKINKFIKVKIVSKEINHIIGL